MKTNKFLVTGLTLSLAVLSVSCSDHYQEGITDGKAQGYKTGYDAGYGVGKTDGDKDGYARGQTYYQAHATYAQGFGDGKAEGIQAGFATGQTDGYNQAFGTAKTQGYGVGKTDGLAQGRTEGYSLGYNDGYSDRSALYYAQGKTAGYSSGYNLGYSDGKKDGYQSGYETGKKTGYDLGYKDGFKDAKLSVGSTSSLKGYANLLSLAHNDLIDYSKIPVPEITPHGIAVNGKMIFEEISLTNKDTMKKNAVIEEYLVVEMAKQVNSKFGLSVERSLVVAKAANHFRKQASKRALTPEDTDAYVSEIAGTDMGTIVRASENAMKGDLSSINAIIEAAAKKNDVSPEKMAQIISMF